MRRSRSLKPSARTAIEVTVVRRAGAIASLRVGGHAGYAPYGDDVVCAGVSALVQAAVHGLRSHTGTAVKVRIAGGRYTLDVVRGDAAGWAVLETALDGIEAIARSHPEHVRVSSGRAAGIGNAPSKSRLPSPRRKGA